MNLPALVAENLEAPSDLRATICRDLETRLEEKGITLSVSESFEVQLVEGGYNPSYGARPSRSAMMRLLEDSLAEEFLSERICDVDSALVDVDDSKQVVIHKESATPQPELAAAGVKGKRDGPHSC